MEDGKFSVTPEDLSKIGGIATAAFGAALHVLSASLLGVTAITITNTIAGEETVHKLHRLLVQPRTLPMFLAIGNASSLLVFAIIVLFFSPLILWCKSAQAHWAERYDVLLEGSVLCLVGFFTFIFFMITMEM